MKVLLTGATGMVGRELGKELVRQGHQIFVITRDREKALKKLPFPATVIEGDLSKEPLRAPELRNVEAVVHLAGENISGGRWTKEQKKLIYDSRVKSTQNLLSSLAESSPLKVLVSTSAVGFYGDRADEVLTEQSSRGHGFLSEVCQDWEHPVLVAERKSGQGPRRSVILRFGVVLGSRGGALEKMLKPAQLGVAGKIGSGQQWMSWIHIDDLLQLILFCLNDGRASGIINAVAPEAVTNRQFMETLNRVFGHKLGFPIPKAPLQIALGEMSQILLYSQRVQSQVLPNLGFQFRFPQLEPALRDLCAHWLSGDSFYFSEQYIDVPPEKIFTFFSEVKNLERITPDMLHFHVLKMSTPTIQDGSLITYQLKVHGVPMKWVTEIKNWNPPRSFEDTQLKGPYNKWHHRHQFEAMGSGTLMTDFVRYRLPMGSFGALAAGALVKKDVQQIFQFRRQVIEHLKI